MNKNVELNINNHEITAHYIKKAFKINIQNQRKLYWQFFSFLMNICKIRKFGCLEEKWLKLTFCEFLWDQAENCVLCGHITKLIPS